MAQIINPDGIGKERDRLAKGVVLSIRELAVQTKPDAQSKDLVAFLILALEKINRTVDVTVVAWEKRDYWVKADKFRMEWAWSAQYSAQLRIALEGEDWASIATIAQIIVQKLSKITIPVKHRLGKPWIGAWKELKG